jgi:pimeloyl-ACP methyl ester carboxylesterase
LNNYWYSDSATIFQIPIIARMKIQITLLMALCLSGTFAQRPSLDPSYPPPGRLIDIGGRKIHLHCTGKGSPTLVLAAGGGAFSVDWYLVQSRVDSNSRVCSFDRAGLGWSDPGPLEETVEETVADLHQALKIAGEKGPYLLVGASIGGIFIQAYQRDFPREVAGLLFSNSSNRVGFATKNKTGLIWELDESEIRSAFPFPAPTEKRKLSTQVPEPFDRLPPHQQAERLWLTERLNERWDTAKSDPASLLSWRKEFLREFDESDAQKGQFPLGKLPVVVISSDSSAHESMRYSRDGAAGRLDFLSSNTLHITAPESGHEIHLFQPDKLVSGLRIALISVRRKIPLKAASMQSIP